MTDTKALIDALNNAAYVGLVAVRSGAQGTGIVTSCRHEAIASVSAVLDELDRMGWVVVPKEADMDMRIAARDDIEHGGPDTAHWAWLSMVAAAPKLVEPQT